MDPRSESLNGSNGLSKEPKTMMAEAYEKADHLVDRVKDKTAEVQKQASNYATITAEYAKQHPWRIAMTAVGIGFVAGAMIFKKNKRD